MLKTAFDVLVQTVYNPKSGSHRWDCFSINSKAQSYSSYYLAFMFPGGVGVIEGSMAEMYDSLQVPNGVSVVVILGYRLLSFWLPSLLGFAAAAYLSRKSPSTEGEQV